MYGDIVQTTVVPTKSDSDVLFCLQLLSKVLTLAHQLSYHESIDHLWTGGLTTWL